MSPWQQALLVYAIAVLAQALGWAWQRKRANAGIVDVVWSLGVGGAAVLAATTGSGAMLPRVLLALLGGLWGLRLALHLWHRVVDRRHPRQQQDAAGESAGPGDPGDHDEGQAVGDHRRRGGAAADGRLRR